MRCAEPTSTPIKSSSSNPTTGKRSLPSPFSPDDHFSKKNKANMSSTSSASVDPMESLETKDDDNSATMLGPGFGMGIDAGMGLGAIHIPPPDPETLKTLQIVRLYLKTEVADLVKTAVETAIESKVGEIREENARLTKENVELTKRVSALESALDDSEQYSRRNSLRVSNIKEDTDENTDDIVLSIAKELNVDISPSDIDRSHRVGKPAASKTRDILVKFATYRARQRLYDKRSSLKNSEYDGVFLNEDLTKSKSKLLYQARLKVKSNYLQGAWSMDGRLFIKDYKDKVFRLTSVSDINAHVSEHPVPRKKKTDAQATAFD